MPPIANSLAHTKWACKYYIMDNFSIGLIVGVQVTHTVPPAGISVC